MSASAATHESDSKPDILGLGLSVVWLSLPTIQYLGAVARSDGQVDPYGQFASLAGLDLTPWYVALIGATVLYACLRAYLWRGDGEARNRR